MAKRERLAPDPKARCPKDYKPKYKVEVAYDVYTISKDHRGDLLHTGDVCIRYGPEHDRTLIHVHELGTKHTREGTVTKHLRTWAHTAHAKRAIRIECWLDDMNPQYHNMRTKGGKPSKRGY